MVASNARALRRHRRSPRVALAALGLGPLAGLASGAALYALSFTVPVVVATGIFALAFTWGLLGSISFLTDEGAERAEERRALRSARVDPGHGQLSLGSFGSLTLAVPDGAAGRIEGVSADPGEGEDAAS